MTFQHKERMPYDPEPRLKEIREIAHDYRKLAKKGLGVQQMHQELNQLTFEDGLPLDAPAIAGIVNFAFYQGDPNTITRIMGQGRI